MCLRSETEAAAYQKGLLGLSWRKTLLGQDNYKNMKK